MDRHIYYKLEGHKVVAAVPVYQGGNNEIRWARVALDIFGDTEVSTVFIGLDYNFCVEGPPIVFETMIFHGPLAGEQERYSTWEEAEAGHKRWVRRVIDEQKH